MMVIVIAGCEDQFEPAEDNHRTQEDIYSDAAFAEGILMNGYTRLPTNSYSFNDVATDDAVTNDKFSAFRNMAIGQWSALYTPVSQWANLYAAIIYLNKLIKENDKIVWSKDPKARWLFSCRNKGEAYGLRALYYYHLLKAHAGIGNDGRLLGIPIITDVLDASSNFNIPRNTFDECMQQIYADLDSAEAYLPLDYFETETTDDLPLRYRNFTVQEYNRVFGEISRQRISSRIVKAIRAQAALLAASPAYNLDNDISKWEKAANFAAEVINLKGGISGLDPKGNLFYTKSTVDVINLAKGKDQSEMLWRGAIYTSYSLEQNNFPPTLFGNGRVNPTQNLVDAFPMANGYPISDPNSGYDPANPYANRDPRLSNYIIYNGSTFAGKTIYTHTNAGDDGINNIKTSTRTGYYLKKLLRDDVNVNPTTLQGQKRFNPHIRYTEIFLIYAEAANEAWGPDGVGGNSFSARDVIAAIRKRAGIAQPDDYLASISSKEDMRKIIRNERRLELCFEGFRFWDLRRWKENISEPAKGVVISGNTYQIIEVEPRKYDDYMYYAPIPYEEVIKMNLIQNKGW